jgi:hypothetical protein
MMGFYLELPSVRLRFLWMMGSAQFFWWVIRSYNDTVQVQPWIPYDKHSVMCLRLGC